MDHALSRAAGSPLVHTWEAPLNNPGKGTRIIPLQPPHSLKSPPTCSETPVSPSEREP